MKQIQRIAMLLMLALSSQNLFSQTTFTSTGTWLCPAGVTSIKVECWGAGGGGAGASNSGNLYTGGGGAGGNYSVNNSITVVPGTTYNVTIGSGGTAGPSSGNTNGSAGGTTNFHSLLFASGGTGGVGGQTSHKIGVGGVNGGLFAFTINTNTGFTYTATPTIVIGTAWTANQSYSLNQQVFNASKLYTVTTAGNSGTAAPTHSSGAVACSGGSGPFATLTYAGVQATGTVSLVGASNTLNNTINYLTVTNMGSGYIAAPTITFSQGPATATASINAINVTGATSFYIGGSGGNSTYIGTCTSNASGGGGGSAGTASNGNNATNASASTAICSTAVVTNSLGGTAVTGGGAGANGFNTTSTVGTAATQVGGGGSGATGVTKVGGAGFRGQIIITYPIISTTGTFAAFAANVGTASTAQSISVSGANMTSGITVTPPVGFEVSTVSDFSSNVGTNASPLTVGTSGNISFPTLFVRIPSSATAGTYSGNLQITSTSATSVNLSIPNSIVSTLVTPILTVSTTSLTSFANTAAGASSAASSFTVSGINLLSDITVTAPTNFQVSLSSSTGFGSSVSLTPDGSGTVAATSIFAIYAPTGSGNYSDNVTVSTSSISNQTVGVSGYLSNFFYKGSGALATTSNWSGTANGLGTNTPNNFTIDNVSYTILSNVSTASVGAWSIAGTGSKVIVGATSNAGVTLTIDKGFAITTTSPSVLDIAAANSGVNSVVVIDSVPATIPSFGTLHTTSEVHFKNTMSITNSATYGKLFVDSIGKTVSFTGNPVIQNSIFVSTGAVMVPSGTSTVFIRMNTGATATINGTMRIGKVAGFVNFGVTTPSSSFGSLQYADAENVGTSLVLGANSTVEYTRNTVGSVQMITGRSDYANLTISDNNTVCHKYFGGNTTISGTLTNSQTLSNLTDTGFTITAGGNISGAGTFTGAGRVRMTGAANTLSGAKFNNFEIASSGTITASATVVLNGTLSLTSGNFIDGGNTITVAGNVTGTGTHTSSSSAGKISLTGASRTITGVTLGNLDLPSGASYNGGSNTITVRGSISGTGTFTSTGIGEILMTGNANNSNISPITVTNLELNNTTRSFVILSTATYPDTTLNITGSLTLVNGSFTVNNGNVLVMENNSNIIRGNGSLSLSGGLINYGTTSTDLVNVTINANCSNGSEIGSTQTPGKVGTLTISPSVNYTFTGGRTVSQLVNNGLMTLTPSTTFTMTFNGALSGTGLINGHDSASIVIANANTVNDTLRFVKGTQKTNNFTINKTGLNGTVVLTQAIKINRTLSLTAGTLDAGTFTDSLKGSVSNNGSFTNGNLILLGTGTNPAGPFTISGAKFSSLEISNNNYTVSGSITVSGILNVKNNVLNAGSSSIVLTSTGSLSRTTGWVRGKLRKNIPIGTSVSKTFEIGDSLNYTPIILTFASVTSTGDITAKTDSAAVEPNFASSLIHPTNYINRYWGLSSTSGLIFTTYNAEFNYVSTDLKGSANSSSVRSYFYSSTWGTGLTTSLGTYSNLVSDYAQVGDFILADCGPASVTPSVTITTPSSTVCTAETVTFTASGINGGTNPIYQWKNNGLSVGSGTSISFLANTLITGDIVTCDLFANNVCQTSAIVTSNSITMTVKQSPSVAQITNGISTITAASLCTLGNTYRYYDATPYGSWSSSNPTVASVTGGSQAGVVTANTNGTATISYNVTATNGCASSSNVLVTVAEQSAPSNITARTNSLCVNDTVKLNSIAPIGTTGIWSSSNNRGTISTTLGSSTIYTGNNAGAGEARYTVTNTTTGCKAFAAYAITVNPTPVVPTITYAPGTPNPQLGAPTGSFCVGKKFRVVATPNVPAGVWSATGSASFAGYDTVIINAVGAGTIKYTYTSAAGCVNSRTMSGNGFTCAARGTMSNEQLAISNSFTMYPNPAKGFINLNVETLIGAGSIIVADLYGKSVKTQNLSMGTNSVNISNLSKGFYLVSIITSEGKTTKKLVVE
jgi:hypothetical protein